MNTLKYFRTLESKDILRSDKSEGLQASFPAEGMKITVGGKELKNMIGQVRFHHKDEEKLAIFSMYAITNLNLEDKVVEEVLRFGESAVIILDGDTFIKRVSDECKRRNLNFKTGLVDYVDKRENLWDMGPFRKYSDLNYQSEWRIVVESGSAGPIKDFYIGDISDIARMCDSKELNSLITVNE